MALKLKGTQLDKFNLLLKGKNNLFKEKIENQTEIVAIQTQTQLHSIH